MSSSIPVKSDKIKYSKLLSAFFCSTSMIVLSILSLLNNMSLDLYSAIAVLKVVIPGSFCFWFTGYIMGLIFENNSGKALVKTVKLTENNEAYKIPSIFEDGSSDEGESEEL